jgi:carbon monoxide dehydrogenase subunit G
MLIKNEFEVSDSIENVWNFFSDIPQVASCLPGAKLTDEIGDDIYKGEVVIGLGPVKLEFGGTADIVERREADRTIVVDASGAEKKGRGQAELKLNAVLTPTAKGTNVAVNLDLQLSGAAAQYGRGMVADVTSVLIGDFATNLHNRMDAIRQGLDPNQVASAKPASGLVIGLRALRMVISRVFRRFFLPYRPSTY